MTPAKKKHVWEECETHSGCSGKEAFLPLLPAQFCNSFCCNLGFGRTSFGPAQDHTLSHPNIPSLSFHMIIIKVLQHPNAM